MERFILFVDVLAYLGAIAVAIMIVIDLFANQVIRYAHIYVLVVAVAWSYSGLN